MSKAVATPSLLQAFFSCLERQTGFARLAQASLQAYLFVDAQRWLCAVPDEPYGTDLGIAVVLVEDLRTAHGCISSNEVVCEEEEEKEEECEIETNRKTVNEQGCVGLPRVKGKMRDQRGKVR